MPRREISDTEEDFGAQKREAFIRLAAVWHDALAAGIEPEVLAQVALFSALRDLVDTYGETAVADFATDLPGRIAGGEFTIPQTLN